MTEHWEISQLSFDGLSADDKIICQDCGWSWKLKDGGNDPYVCHKCDSDNSQFYNPKSNFAGKVDANMVIGGVTALAGLGGSISQAKASKQMSKSDLQKEIDSRCGKDKSKALLKKKRNAYLQCKEDAINKIDSEKRRISEDVNKQKESEKQLIIQQSQLKEKSERNKMYLGIGIAVVFVVGIIIYKKISK
jgi:hypothetical protein